MIEYMLDTNIVSALVKSPAGNLARRVRAVAPSAIGISLITAGEARFGYIKKRSSRLKHDVEAVLGSLAILPLDHPADLRFAELRALLEGVGTPIGSNDMWIAAHALAVDCILVTANEREFRRVPGLTVENWLG